MLIAAGDDWLIVTPRVSTCKLRLIILKLHKTAWLVITPSLRQIRAIEARRQTYGGITITTD